MNERAPGARCFVRRLPSDFDAYGDEPLQLRAAATGKVGLLEIRFGLDGARTVLLPGHATGPQRVGRAHYLDSRCPGMATVFIQSVSAGVLQGDRLALEIEAQPGTHALVTTQSATRVYRMERNYATQRIGLDVQPGAYLEFLPDYLIPYRGARFYQEVHVRIARDATLLFCDSSVPGRVAFGESFAYERLTTRLDARGDDGVLRVADTLVLSPPARPPQRPGILGVSGCLASMYVLTTAIDAAGLADALHATLAEIPGVLGSASRLPHDDGVALRLLARSPRVMQYALHHAWAEARQLLLQAPVPTIHTIKYGQEPSLSPEEG